MRMVGLLIPFIFCLFTSAYAQYPPPAGQDGSTAIHKDSSLFVAWATGCTTERGPMDISNLSAGPASAGEPVFATGTADNQIVSLGDGGVAVLTFAKPVTNGAGPDFAVFENGFADAFLELAFVEVSSNGLDYFRFSAVSLTQTDEQIGPFGLLDATKLHNLAGKYRVEYGTPFDLDELAGDPLLDKNHITHIRVLDAVGSLEDDYATMDSQGNRVNDPWPTAFESGGFDLDAVGVIHEGSQAVDDGYNLSRLWVYPSPADRTLFVETGEFAETLHVLICDLSGKPLLTKESAPISGGKAEIPLDNLAPGIYIGIVHSNGHCHSFKIIRN